MAAAAAGAFSYVLTDCPEWDDTSGLYLYRLRIQHADDVLLDQTRKMILLK